MITQKFIDTYFKPKKWYSLYRYSKQNGFRVDKNNKLEEYFCGFSSDWWSSATWKEFNDFLHKKAKKKEEENKRLKYENDTSNFNWDIKVGL